MPRGSASANVIASEPAGQRRFGRVYRCFDELLNRAVAVKVPHRKLLNNPELYLAEARVLAGLETPAIVRVYDYGMTEDGLCSCRFHVY